MRRTGLLIIDDIDATTDWTQRQRANFFKKVNKDGPVPKHKPELGPCWQWIGGCDGFGQRDYGSFSAFGRMRKAHRVSWLMHKGAIPKSEGFHGTCVCHKCDNKKCVRPDHLFLGTHADNMRDMEAKGRADHPAGERNGMNTHPEARLTGDKNWQRQHPDLVLRGESRPNAKMDDEKVRQLKLLKINGTATKDLAQRFGISRALVQKIIHSDAWKHVKMEC